MGGNNGCPNDENDYEVGVREERARVVAFCRMCSANNADWRGITTTPLLPGVKVLTDRDARMFAFIADCLERGEHVSRTKA